MNRKYLYPILIVVVTVIIYFAEKYVDKQTEAYPETVERSASYFEFEQSILPTSTTGTVIAHQYFTLSYAEAHEQAEWVAYELQKKQIKNSDFKRPYFVQDRKVKSGSADWRNYKNSGYDRGHLCPAADREFDYNAYHETFLTSNISPQDNSFNGGIWNRLEQKTRYWAKKYDGVFVITGGVLRNGLTTIGDERVSVPKEFYKIVVDTRGGELKTIAFLVPNKGSDQSFYEYTVTIDAIEEKTGIDFFPKLSEAKEKKLESTIDRSGW
ncbi:DNA/RNA non-specific endonuclease [Rasiella rasia]|uniref:Endonuclease n=1 Tax=Rasiella rasia TaxID=2744027 RepID=A0A6G6GLG2_9FLAO|nr:DNA/RNA non-specific endonuclease [Rasiella rasia]QIE59388.1 DNA/RNA non-specific endonuclease [Rasiella rasia]